MSRLKNSTFNASANLSTYILKILLSFVTRTTFIYILGKEYLGLDSLLINVVAMLSVAELGISTAVSFSLYKPLSEKRFTMVSSLMTLYKKAYIIIGLTIAIGGSIFSLSLSYFIQDADQFNNLYIVFFIYLANTVAYYFISYKDILIIADQKGYRLAKYNIASIVALNTIQIVVLILSSNYIAYLIVMLITNIAHRTFINRLITKEYQNINFNSKERISAENRKVIVKNIKAMFFHKIGDYVINGTDNLIIARYLSISTVGLYSNYMLITTIFTSLTSQAFNALTASFGNLLTTQNKSLSHSAFEQINILNFAISGLLSLLFAVCANQLIELWIGSEYLLDQSTVILISISFFVTTVRISPGVVKSAAGLFDIDKFTPLIQSAVNLIATLVLIHHYGLNGVLIGTIISSVALPSWQRPYIIYKYIFDTSSVKYFINYFKYILLIAVNYIVLSATAKVLEDNLSPIYSIIAISIITTLVFSATFMATEHRNEHFRKLIVTIKYIALKTVRRRNT